MTVLKSSCWVGSFSDRKDPMTSFCNASLVDTDIIIELQPIYTLTCNHISYQPGLKKILLILWIVTSQPRGVNPSGTQEISSPLQPRKLTWPRKKSQFSIGNTTLKWWKIPDCHVSFQRKFFPERNQNLEGIHYTQDAIFLGINSRLRSLWRDWLLGGSSQLVSVVRITPDF